MEVLSSSSIETYIIPWLSIGSRGKTDEVPTLKIVQAILYRVKTGCQWRSLPVKQFFSTKPYTWQGVYHHFRQWIAEGSWRGAFVALLKEHPRVIDLSSAQSSMPRIRQPSAAEKRSDIKGENGAKQRILLLSAIRMVRP